MNSIWSGAIGYGLVNISVKLNPAVQESMLDPDPVNHFFNTVIRATQKARRTQYEPGMNTI